MPENEDVRFIAASIDNEEAMGFLEAIESFDDEEEALHALNENATFQKIHQSHLDEDGKLEDDDIVFNDAESGQYVVFGATYDGNSGVDVTEEGNLVVEDETTIFGAEGVLVQHSPSDVTVPGKIEPGDDAEFDIKETNLTGENFAHTVLLYDESTFTDSSTLVKTSGRDLTIDSDIGELNGNLTVMNETELLNPILSELAGSEVSTEHANITFKTGDTVLNASVSTLVTDESTPTVNVSTLEDWDETDYRWVHVSVNETGDMATSTGTLELEEEDDTSPSPGPGPGPGPGPSPPGDEDGDKKDKLDVSDASLSTSEIEVGDSVDVSATATNDGDKAGTYTIELTVDGDVVEEQDVELEAGASETVTFTRTFNDAGEYDIEIGGASAGTLTVVEPEPEPEPAAFDVGDAELSESEIAAGDSVDVTATVSNTGEESGTHTAELTVDGDVVAEQDVTLEGGESDTVTFTETFDDAGEYDVAVDDSSAGTLTVVAEDDDDDGDDDGLPGFGALVAIVALLGTIALRVRTTDDS
ncbi:CARDB domain-containing protein [Halomontanus rarus]|uniref:CARDB domain-containing protein n=1 Tax=Halomontanus rarus TaxID=3034020 RepID=UPI0023E85B69|nr:CARDB domain-containing protein [Halovivax sp. TS33]